MKKNARESGERRYDQSRSDPGVVCCLIACARRVYWPGSRRQEQSVTQRFGNPTIGKQRKSKQFKSARVVRTLPRTGVLLPTFLTSARGAQPNRGSVSSVGYPLARMTGHAPLVRVALDQPERRHAYVGIGFLLARLFAFVSRAKSIWIRRLLRSYRGPVISLRILARTNRTDSMSFLIAHPPVCRAIDRQQC